MNCFSCNGTMIESTTTHFVDMKKCIVIIKNVPCLECSQCGDKCYTDEVAEKLDKIVETVGGLMSEITVIDYQNRVA